MKIAIVGAGIVGVTTAWELACDGHEVHVFDRRNAAAEESSFATAGLVGPSWIAPWTASGRHLQMLRALLSSDAPLQLRRPFKARDLAWFRQWQRASRLESDLANRTRLQRLAFYSRARLHEIVQARALSLEGSAGCLVLLRGKREKKRVQPGLDLLREAGADAREIDADEARRIEPALSADTRLAGAIHLPQDEVGNCRQFAMLLKREAEDLGVQFFFNCDIAPLSRAAPRSLTLAAGSEAVPYDAIAVCAGVNSAALLAPLGLRIPLAPVYGLSLSATIREPLNAPRSAVMDERHKVAITRLGLRVRVAGTAEIGGDPATPHPASLQTLYKVLHDWFPGAAQLNSGVQQWKGARPMLPDGPPIIGPSGVPGVWLNLGHGANGWALACGSARVLADMVGDRASEIDLEGLGMERLLGQG